jgi:plastocyanin
MVLRTATLIVVGSMVLVGCSSDDDTEIDAVPSVAGDPLPTAPANDQGTTGQVQVEIAISDFAFVGDQQVPVGGRVVVTNNDGASHTWTAVDGSFDSGTLNAGDSFEFTFDDPGIIEYRCSFHPSMTGIITVTD